MRTEGTSGVVAMPPRADTIAAGTPKAGQEQRRSRRAGLAPAAGVALQGALGASLLVIARRPGIAHRGLVGAAGAAALLGAGLLGSRLVTGGAAPVAAAERAPASATASPLPTPPIALPSALPLPPTPSPSPSPSTTPSASGSAAPAPAPSPSPSPSPSRAASMSPKPSPKPTASKTAAPRRAPSPEQQKVDAARRRISATPAGKVVEGAFRAKSPATKIRILSDAEFYRQHSRSSIAVYVYDKDEIRIAKKRVNNSSRDKLAHVLAHEMTHAVDLARPFPKVPDQYWFSVWAETRAYMLEARVARSLGLNGGLQPGRNRDGSLRTAEQTAHAVMDLNKKYYGGEGRRPFPREWNEWKRTGDPKVTRHLFG